MARYTLEGIVYKLTIHQDAEADLDALWTSSPVAAADIAVFLEELAEDQWLLDRLSQHGFSLRADPDPTSNIDVSRWQRYWNRGKNLWRVKLWDLEAIGLQFRIVYAFVPETSRYHILGVLPRSFNYESDSPYTIRILAAYDGL